MVGLGLKGWVGVCCAVVQNEWALGFTARSVEY